ncbi:hypothetical protein CRE_27970 [Caenorhabditis remanei]|uniref:SAC3/GANP/THP3 conserved domain-containing protein n=1 Tax=Caenorhabditis remanei TaxID=31234 RepID=E3NRI8_CAERE|nr:hypothetical protein CRE_27970 [Caenorhabditis remanei]
MNNETLGKRLQTLRYFYEEFEKRGIPCVNEAEFRSYDVMLHMNDTNILSQVLSYRSEVRQSQSVRLSLQLASAFRDKNYYRFFRLLQTQASYLQCCVAHKLFTVTRTNAISIMANAYGRNSFPLDKLQRTLGFDNVSDLTSVLNTYGLRTEGSDYVVLSRDDLTLNETVPITTYQWIDQKTSEKLSSVVYGPGLFQFIASRCDVSNSFNHHHEYVHDKVLDSVLCGSDIPPVNNSSISSFSQSGGSLSMQATIEQRKKAEEERLRVSISKVAEAQRHQLVEKLITRVIDQVTAGLIDEEIRKARILRKQIIAFENARKQKEEQERLIKEMELKRKEKEKEVARNLAMKIAKEVTDKDLRRITVDEMKKERRERERKLAQHIVSKFWKEVLRSVDCHVKTICVEMVNEKEEILDRLAVISDRLSKQWLLQFWNRWREWVQIKKMMRRCVPRWESEDYANNLVKKYGGKNQTTSPVFPILDRPTNHIQLKIFKKNRQNRIVRDAFGKWRARAHKMSVLKKQAKDRQKRENEFYRRFEKSAKIETRFKFDAPDDWMKTKRRSSETFQEKKPTPDFHNGSFQDLDTSLYVARRHLEEWEPVSEIPDDLKEKLKRRRDSFDRICEEHILKKKKEEALLCDGKKNYLETIRMLFYSEAKKNNLHIEKVTKEADTLLDETLRYTAELDRMMADIKSRRVDDL